jgi:hypothetical protein
MPVEENFRKQTTGKIPAHLRPMPAPPGASVNTTEFFEGLKETNRVVFSEISGDGA